MPRHTLLDKYDILELARRIITIIDNSDGRVLSSMEIKEIGGLGRAIHRWDIQKRRVTPAVFTHVSALYVSPKGPYPKLLLDCWDNRDGSQRYDARHYAGPRPIIAHPPCGPWGPLRHRCVSDDRALALHAVAQVRKWGGVLEHPKYSTLWEFCELPYPGQPRDSYGGFTIEVDQSDWGHRARKPTWLYLVRVDPMAVETPPKRAVTRVIGSGRRAKKMGLKQATWSDRVLTPIDFARYLIRLAGTVSPYHEIFAIPVTKKTGKGHQDELRMKAVLLRKVEHTQVEIANMLGVTQSYVSKLLRMGEETQDHG